MGRFAGSLAEEYDLIPQAVPGYMELQCKLASKVASRFLRDVRPRIELLEIGPGTGITTNELLRVDPRIHDTAIDKEPDMLALLQGNCAAHIASGRLVVLGADALEYLPEINDESYDCCATAHTLHNFTREERRRLTAEVYRILRPSGFFINTDKYRPDDAVLEAQLFGEQLAQYRRVFAQKGKPVLAQLWTEHELEDMRPEVVMHEKESLEDLAAQGFIDVRLTDRVGLYGIATATKPWKADEF